MAAHSKPAISGAEWRILECLWEQSPRTADEGVEPLVGVTDWHPRTVKTLLHRLVKKGALRFDRDGKRYRYAPRVAREDCTRQASPRLTSAEIAELKRLLDSKLAKRSEKRK